MSSRELLYLLAGGPVVGLRSDQVTAEIHVLGNQSVVKKVRRAAGAPLSVGSPQRWLRVLGFGMPSMGHSSVPTVERVIASTISRVPSGSVTHLL